jgi:hypothetical protein
LLHEDDLLSIHHRRLQTVEGITASLRRRLPTLLTS